MASEPLRTLFLKRYHWQIHIALARRAKAVTMPLEQDDSIYLPFEGGRSILSMGLMPVPESAWLEFGQDPASDLAAKRTLLETRHVEVFCALPEAVAPAAELLRSLAAHLARYHSTMFRLTGDRLTNAATAEMWNIAQPPLHPLDVAGRLVTEDLCILQSDGNRYVLLGASLCAPARWFLSEKIGRPLVAIHAPVPGYAAALERPVDNFFAALKPNRLVGRFNWGIADDPEPFQPVARTTAAVVTPANAGERLWLRVERQILRRLPETAAVIFTIRTYITRLDRAIRTTGNAQDLAAAISAMPPDMQRYKHIAPLAPSLLAWLEARAKS